MEQREGMAKPVASSLDRWRRASSCVPLRLRVVAVVALIQLALFIFGGYTMLANARESTRQKIQASLALARRYAVATVRSLMRSTEPELALRLFPAQMDQPRHVRLHVIDSLGSKIVPTAVMAERAGREVQGVPAWFSAFIAVPTDWVELPFAIGGQRLGTIVITTEPQDEIAEVWEDFMDLVPLLVGAYLAMLATLCAAVTQALGPLAPIGRVLTELETGNYSLRVGGVLAPDLAPIARGCNALSAGLEKAIAEKDRLNRQLVTLHDAERKHIAMELHDEFGPCLFGIKVEPSSLAKAPSRTTGGDDVTLRARSILELVVLMQESNRSLLHRLRPMAIGQLPLPQVLEDLTCRLAARSPEVEVAVTVDPMIDQACETTAPAIYRVVQDAVTNALRHAAPRRIDVVVGLRAGPGGDADAGGAWYEISVTDVGCRIERGDPGGAGLHGMRERVVSLAGTIDFRRGSQGGIVVLVRLPEPRSSRLVATEPSTLAA